MEASVEAMSRLCRLQWVHGPRTVVMVGDARQREALPEGFNGSTVREPWLWQQGGLSQWCKTRFNGSTVREPWLWSYGQLLSLGTDGFNGSTVREPWLCLLLGQANVLHRHASMGPRSENRG